MIWLILIIIIICCLFLFLLWTNITVQLTYQFDFNKKHRGYIELTFLGIPFLRKRIAFSKQKELQEGKLIANLKNLYTYWIEEKEKWKGKVTLDEVSWITVIGTDEIISTSLTAAMFSVLKENIALYTFAYTRVACKPVIQVKPIYQGTAFHTKIYVRGKLRGYQAISLLKRLKNIIS